MSVYQEAQREHQTHLINSSDLFENTPAGVIFRGKKREFILKDGQHNLYSAIRGAAISYFRENHIDWWGGKGVSGHVLSSQIACLNHLFPLRQDPELLRQILQSVLNLQIEEVLPIPQWLDKEDDAHYIAFEVVSHDDHLNEGKLTRGANCTSVDALIIVKLVSGEAVLLPIEWKYTEFYENADKSTEDRDYEPKGSNGRGKERMRRYVDLIERSSHLKPVEKYQGSVYFQEPFYQLMRQTLWAEQVLKQEPEYWYNATKCIHLHIVPEQNKDLLERNYKRFPFMNGLEQTWNAMLQPGAEYILLDPSQLYENVGDEHKTLKDYLRTRYWS